MRIEKKASSQSIRQCKGFCTKILGDIDLEGMVILVCYDDQVIAEINYEKGIDNMEIEIVSSQEGFPKQIFFSRWFFQNIR